MKTTKKYQKGGTVPAEGDKVARKSNKKAIQSKTVSPTDQIKDYQQKKAKMYQMGGSIKSKKK